MLKRFAQTKNAFDAVKLVGFAVLVPDCAEHVKRLVELAETADRDHSGFGGEPTTLGAALLPRRSL